MGMYVHVPFCATKCPYCDFNTFQGIENLMGPYLEALTTELDGSLSSGRSEIRGLPYN